MLWLGTLDPGLIEAYGQNSIATCMSFYTTNMNGRCGGSIQELQVLNAMDFDPHALLFIHAERTIHSVRKLLVNSRLKPTK